MAKNNSELKSIQKKLMAAIAMVLVASVMVVSSSYAWFTLSTAPEVKGITTSVGSNGNLEMALRTGALDAIVTGDNISNDFPEANKHWGNLVDLEDTSYGLSRISLAPARLNVTATPTTTSVTTTVTLESADKAYKAGDTYDDYKITTVGEVVTADGVSTQSITYNVVTYTYKVPSGTTNYLLTPVYGTDGRLSQLASTAETGIYNATTKTFQITSHANVADYGVRAIGTQSGLSNAEIALRNARTVVFNAIQSVTNAAQDSMGTDAGYLANIIIQNKAAGVTKLGNTEYDQIITALNNLDKIATSLKETLDQIVIAVGVYQGLTITEVKYDNGAITTNGVDAGGNTKDIDWNGDEQLNVANVGPHASLLAAYADLATLTGNLKSARNAMPARNDAEDATYEYSACENALTYLMDATNLKITVAGVDYTFDQFKDNALSLAGDIMSSGVSVKMGAGIYAEIARFIDNYSGGTNVKIPYSALGSTTEGSMSIPVTLVTVAEEPASGGYHLDYANNWLGKLNVDAGEGDASEIKSLTDLYGYVLDFAFRTNAADSNLMLQTSAVDRVSESYGEGASTQGSGSYMSFTLGGTAGYTLAQMVDLMSAVRVVIFNDDGDILGVAKLDMTVTTTGEGESAVTTTAYVVSDDEQTVTAKLYLCEYSVNTKGALIASDLVAEEDAALMELTQNMAVGVSALVYLDGDLVDNGDVAISGNSVNGTMNLQFSSSAALVPMDYTFTEESKGTLTAPSAEFAGQTLNITNVANATAYEITYNGQTQTVDAAEGATTSVDLSSILGSLTTGQTYTIEIVATASGYTDSTKTTVTYTAQ